MRNGGGLGALGLVSALGVSEGFLPYDKNNFNTLQLVQPLNGNWDFFLDPYNKGMDDRWFAPQNESGTWQRVTVPHTWQIVPEYADYYGIAWYKKSFFVPDEWKGKNVRIEFEAVYHSARVWLNGQPVGEHLRKGYTAFFIDVTQALHYNTINMLVVQADNRFDEHMLPRGTSFDWAADGGIIRPVSLHITMPAFTERIAITTRPDIKNNKADIDVVASITNKFRKAVALEITYLIREDKSAKIVANVARQHVYLNAGERKDLKLIHSVIHDPLLWHFDHPDLYVLELELWKNGERMHTFKETFGIRSIEINNTGFYLNGERVWLMGVERMAGSNPDYGLAEPTEWIAHDHRDLKHLNCVFTRVHWPQDKRVLDYCDRQGIFIQSEIPTWGYKTFAGMKDHPSEDIMNNGLEQLREMIQRDKNHPSIFSWGLCNEINGQNPPAYEFAANMLKEAKRLNPDRLCSYASNSLQTTKEAQDSITLSPANGAGSSPIHIRHDVSKLMDFVEWNEYYESWYKGTVQDMEKNLEKIHQAFPDKPIVISEYGWCRCMPDRLVGDPQKIAILKSHDEVFRKHDYVAGLIFFDYNDYRTHFGDKGIGPLKQRIHGVVDLYGARKSSYDVLRYESGPILSLNGWLHDSELHVTLETRKQIPDYVLRNYILHWIVYADQNIPIEEGNILLPDLKPGDHFSNQQKIKTLQPEKILVKILRPTGFSTISMIIVNGTDHRPPVSEY